MSGIVQRHKTVFLVRFISRFNGQLKIGVFMLLVCSSITLQAQDSVYVNDVRVPQATLNQLASFYKIQIIDGYYWYDKYTGAWGLQDGPTIGFILPYMQIGGRLKADASNGNTGVFVNNRELHWKDVAYLQQFIKVVPGRFWADSQGNVGYEGQQAYINLYQLSKKSGKTFYRNSYTGIGSGGDNGTFYVIGKDFSYDSW